MAGFGWAGKWVAGWFVWSFLGSFWARFLVCGVGLFLGLVTLCDTFLEEIIFYT